jgi:hypothetical protein
VSPVAAWAASAASSSAVASIGCWSNGDISPPRGHHPLPTGERCPSAEVWASMSQSSERRPVATIESEPRVRPATIRARGSRAFS